MAWLIHAWHDSRICDMTHTCAETRARTSWVAGDARQAALVCCTYVTCHTWMRHRWVTSRIIGPRHVWMCRDVAYECVVTSHMNVSWIAVDARQVARVCCTADTGHTWISYVRHEESRHVLLGHVTYECVVTSHVNVSLVAADAGQVVLVCCANESCHTWMSQSTCKWVISYVNAPCHKWSGRITYERVMSRMKESRHVRMCDVTCECVM